MQVLYFEIYIYLWEGQFPTPILKHTNTLQVDRVTLHSVFVWSIVSPFNAHWVEIFCKTRQNITFQIALTVVSCVAKLLHAPKYHNYSNNKDLLKSIDFHGAIMSYLANSVKLHLPHYLWELCYDTSI